MSYFVARSMFFLVTCSFGSECCRLRNSATALAGNSVSQTYPKSLARCTASPEQGGTGGDGKKHSSSVHIAQRQKNPFEKNSKNPLHSLWAFRLKSLDISSSKKLGPEKLITSYPAVFFASVEGNANPYFHNNC